MKTLERLTEQGFEKVGYFSIAEIYALGDERVLYEPKEDKILRSYTIKRNYSFKLK
jgi:hypothetical protein